MESGGKCGSSLVAQMVKNLPAMQETRVQSLGWEDPLEKENGNPLQYSCLRNPMNREAWQATVHGVAKSQTQLSMRAHTYHEYNKYAVEPGEGEGKWFFSPIHM